MAGDRLVEPTRTQRLGRLLLIGVVDVAVAVALGTVASLAFGAWAGNDSNPPVCSNYWGRNVACTLTYPVIFVPTFVVVVGALLAFQVVRSRRRTREV